MAMAQDQVHSPFHHHHSGVDALKAPLLATREEALERTELGCVEGPLPPLPQEFYDAENRKPRLDEPLTTTLDLTKPLGMRLSARNMVLSVRVHGQACTAGVRQWQVVTHVNSKSVETLDELQQSTERLRTDGATTCTIHLHAARVIPIECLSSTVEIKAAHREHNGNVFFCAHVLRLGALQQNEGLNRGFPYQTWVKFSAFLRDTFKNVDELKRLTRNLDFFADDAPLAHRDGQTQDRVGALQAWLAEITAMPLPVPAGKLVVSFLKISGTELSDEPVPEEFGGIDPRRGAFVSENSVFKMAHFRMTWEPRRYRLFQHSFVYTDVDGEFVPKGSFPINFETSVVARWPACCCCCFSPTTMNVPQGDAEAQLPIPRVMPTRKGATSVAPLVTSMTETTLIVSFVDTTVVPPRRYTECLRWTSEAQKDRFLKRLFRQIRLARLEGALADALEPDAPQEQLVLCTEAAAKLAEAEILPASIAASVEACRELAARRKARDMLEAGIAQCMADPSCWFELWESLKAAVGKEDCFTLPAELTAANPAFQPLMGSMDIVSAARHQGTDPLVRAQFIVAKLRWKTVMDTDWKQLATAKDLLMRLDEADAATKALKAVGVADTTSVVVHAADALNGGISTQFDGMRRTTAFLAVVEACEQVLAHELEDHMQAEHFTKILLPKLQETVRRTGSRVGPYLFAEAVRYFKEAGLVGAEVEANVEGPHITPEKALELMRKLVADWPSKRMAPFLVASFIRDSTFAVVTTDDKQEAAALLERSAADGLPWAHMKLAEFKGHDGTRDGAAKAVAHFKAAADLRYPPAYVKLALCFRSGMGVSKDHNEEKKFTSLAEAKKLTVPQHISRSASEHGRRSSRHHHHSGHGGKMNYHRTASDPGSSTSPHPTDDGHGKDVAEEK